MASNTDENTKSKERATHVMFVENDPEYPAPVFKDSLKECTDIADKIIKKNPDAKCAVYQLRADLLGEVKIIRQDFNN